MFVYIRIEILSAWIFSLLSALYFVCECVLVKGVLGIGSLFPELFVDCAQRVANLKETGEIERL